MSVIGRYEVKWRVGSQPERSSGKFLTAKSSCDRAQSFHEVTRDYKIPSAVWVVDHKSGEVIWSGDSSSKDTWDIPNYFRLA